MRSKKNVTLCERCLRNPSTGSAILSGRYFRDICKDCVSLSVIVSSGDARWQRTIDAEDHEADIQQPWNSDGTINTRFAKLYPKQAAALFTEKEIRDANN